MLNVLVILGSARRGRLSDRVAAFVMARLDETAAVNPELVDLKALDLPIMEERLGRIDTPPPGVPELGAKITAADALVIVTPEYNRGYPGVLKNALDYFYAQYKRTPVAIVTVSDGRHGGVNAWAQLVTVLTHMGAIVVPVTVAVEDVEETFSPDGDAIEPAYVRRVDRMIAELIWMASRLRD